MQKQQGFTLVELAVSLVVIGLVLGMVSLPLMRQLNDRLGRVPGGQDAQDIQAALAMYMQTMGRLPCGSADAGGVENATLSGRKVQFLPWKTLGLPAGYDKYGSMFGYVVDPGICSAPVQWSGLLDQSPVVNVEFWGAAGKIAGNAVPVAVISYGKNRAGTVDRNGLRFGDAAASAKEKGQAIGQSPAMLYGRVSEAVQEFDDEVLVLPALLLANRASLGGYPVVRQPAFSGP